MGDPITSGTFPFCGYTPVRRQRQRLGLMVKTNLLVFMTHRLASFGCVMTQFRLFRLEHRSDLQDRECTQAAQSARKWRLDDLPGRPILGRRSSNANIRTGSS